MARYTAGELVQSAESSRYLQIPLPDVRRMIAEGTIDNGQIFVSADRIQKAAQVLRDHLALQDTLQREAAENNRHTDNQKQFAKIEGRFSNIEAVAMRPFYKGWPFWINFAIGVTAIIISFLAWQRPNQTGHQSSIRATAAPIDSTSVDAAKPSSVQLPPEQKKSEPLPIPQEPQAEPKPVPTTAEGDKPKQS